MFGALGILGSLFHFLVFSLPRLTKYDTSNGMTYADTLAIFCEKSCLPIVILA